MSITQTSTMQPSAHREKVTFTDMYGATSFLYIHASQAANRETLIAARLATMQANEAAMTALIAAAGTTNNTTTGGA